MRSVSNVDASTLYVYAILIRIDLNEKAAVDAKQNDAPISALRDRCTVTDVSSVAHCVQRHDDLR
jgi:hypothetical protein